MAYYTPAASSKKHHRSDHLSNEDTEAFRELSIALSRRISSVKFRREAAARDVLAAYTIHGDLDALRVLDRLLVPECDPSAIRGALDTFRHHGLPMDVDLSMEQVDAHTAVFTSLYGTMGYIALYKYRLLSLRHPAQAHYLLSLVEDRSITVYENVEALVTAAASQPPALIDGLL